METHSEGTGDAAGGERVMRAGAGRLECGHDAEPTCAVHESPPDDDPPLDCQPGRDDPAEDPRGPHTIDDRATSLRDWADLVCNRFVPLQVAPRDPDEMRGRITTRHVGHLQACVVISAAQSFIRTKKLVSKDTPEVFAVGLVDRGTGYLEQDGRECEVSAGAFALYDTSRPFAWRFDDDFRMRVYTWPLESVLFTECDSLGVTAVEVSNQRGVGRLVAPMFAQLTEQPPDISASGSIRIARELAEMAVTAALEVSHEAPTTADGGIMASAQAYIEERLTDPSLNTDQVAAAFFISTRTLHRLFARHGLTVAGWIKARRLEACRRALENGRESDPPIREIAARYGFVNASSFSREFAHRFGESPRQYRVNRLG